MATTPTTDLSSTPLRSTPSRSPGDAAPEDDATDEGWAPAPRGKAPAPPSTAPPIRVMKSRRLMGALPGLRRAVARRFTGGDDTISGFGWRSGARFALPLPV